MATELSDGRLYLTIRSRMDKSARRDLSLWVSTDNCARREKRELLWSGPSAYSDITILRDGALGVLFEAGNDRYDDQIIFQTHRFIER